jgi:hypothetical protein
LEGGVQHFLRSRRQAFVVVGDDKLDASEAAIGERA